MMINSFRFLCEHHKTIQKRKKTKGKRGVPCWQRRKQGRREEGKGEKEGVLEMEYGRRKGRMAARVEGR